MRNPLNLSDLEMNVLQVAVDHMVEHLEGLISDGPYGEEENSLYCDRLKAAKRLRRLFDYQPTNTSFAVKQMKEAMK